MWGGGTVPPKTMNAIGFYLLLLVLFILTSHHECELSCSNDFREINREY